MFQRLKKFIDVVFNPTKHILLEQIFMDEQSYYAELKRLDASKKELSHLKELCSVRKPFTIEFSGVPRTGKTTVINNLYDFFKKAGFKVTLISELTTSEYYKQIFYKTIVDLPKYELNLEIFNETKRQLENAINSDNGIILIDISLCNRLIWMYRLVSKKLLILKYLKNFYKKILIIYVN